MRNVVVGAGSGEGGEVTSEHGERITATRAAPIPISVVLSQSSSTSNTSGTSASTTNTTSTNASAGTNNTNTSSADASASPSASTSGGAGGLDALQEHYVTSYSAAELKTYHCERVRKMPLSGLDPSMLLGFLCRDVGEWVDLRRRVDEVCDCICKLSPFLRGVMLMVCGFFSIAPEEYIFDTGRSSQVGT